MHTFNSQSVAPKPSLKRTRKQESPAKSSDTNEDGSELIGEGQVSFGYWDVCNL